MSRGIRLLVVMVEAALLYSATSFVLVFTIALTSPATTSTVMRNFELACVFLVPTAAAPWWVFRRLRPYYSQREVRAATGTYAFVAPIAYGAGLAVGPVLGGYMGILLGDAFAIIGAILEVVLLVGVATLFGVSIALRILNLQERVEAN
jgi:hypothetical protein